MSFNGPAISIYCQGTFDIANPTAAQQTQMLDSANELASSGFGTILLGQWHVHIDGTIYYNDTLYTAGGSDLEWSLSTIPPALKKGARYVVVTFGPTGGDFDHITANLTTFQTAVQYLFDNYQIDGIDFDIEGSYSTENQQTLATLAEWASSQGKLVTAAPYTYMDWWQGLLQQSTHFNWMNLQMYAYQNDPSDYGPWVQGLTGYTPHPQTFLSYGFKPAAGISPNEVTFTLKSIRSTYPDVNNAFIWRYEDIRGKASQYHGAIMSGLGFVGP